MRSNLLTKAHTVIGLATVLVFFATGIYMRFNFPNLYHTNEAIRFLYRANHVYVLMAGLLNVAIALNLRFSVQKWRRQFQIAGTLLLLLAPVLLITAFGMEPQHMSPERPLTSYGIFAAALGTLAHFIANVQFKKK